MNTSAKSPDLVLHNGRFTMAAAAFAHLDDGAPPPAMPDWSDNAPASDLRSFWGAFGCACWAV
ncbi:hypothetical protein [Cupriavidus campinensis]